MGSVTDIVKRYVPSSYRALCGITNSYYNLTELQALANYVQYRLFATVPGSSNEATTWNLSELQLLGMLTTLQFIPTAVDFWGSALQTQQTAGTEEDVSYFDRRPELWKIYDKIAAEAADLGETLGVNLYTIPGVVPDVTYGDNGRGILITDDPANWPEQFITQSEDGIYWSYGE